MYGARGRRWKKQRRVKRIWRPSQLSLDQMINKKVKNLIYSVGKSKLVQKQLNKICYLDPLTSAYNVNAFTRKLKFSEGGNFYFLDIDDFKLINTRYGHFVGSMLLKKYVLYIDSLIGQKGEIYRVGGDEFAVYFPKEFQVDLSLMEEFSYYYKGRNIVLRSTVVEIKFIRDLCCDKIDFEESFFRAQRKLIEMKKSKSRKVEKFYDITIGK